MTEHAIQKELVLLARAASRTGVTDADGRRIRLTDKARAALDLLHAIPNGGGRSKAEAGRLKAEGVRAGIPDIAVPLDGGRMLYIELKTDTGRLSKNQAEVIDRFRQLGHTVHVCRSADEAWHAILNAL